MDYELPHLQLEACRCIALLTADGGTKCIDGHGDVDPDAVSIERHDEGERSLTHFDLMKTVELVFRIIQEA